MRRFCLHALGFALVQCLVAGSILSVYEKDPEAYLAATIDKHDRLASLSSPKLILIGGSETTFGTNSAVLEEAVGLPTVNMATQGGHGLGFKLREVGASIGPGDIVVISYVYEMYANEVSSGLSLWRLLEARPTSLRFFDLTAAHAAMDGAHHYVREVFRKTVRQLWTGRVVQSPPPYRRNFFNRYGDMAGQWELVSPGIEGKRLSVGRIDRSHLSDVITQLNDFGDLCEQRGARVLVFHPPIPQSRYEHVRDRLQEIAASLDEGLRIQQLNRPGELLFPDELFFDTLYHLSRQGVEARTSVLARSLQEALR